MSRSSHVLDDSVIEIDSSPEPAPIPRTRPLRARSSSRTRSIPTRANSKGKGKEKATSQTARKAGGAVTLGPVIEITDSESEETQPQNNRLQGSQSNHQAQAGSSHSQRSEPTMNTLQPKPVGVSMSLDNIPVASGSASGSVQTVSKKRKATPLFLQSQSDEENDPPFFNDGAQKKVNRVNKGKEKEKGKGKEKEIEVVQRELELEDDDWDPEFVNKPFPFLYFGQQSPRVMLAPDPAPALAPAPATPALPPFLRQNAPAAIPARPAQAPAAPPVNPAPPVPVAAPAPVAQPNPVQHIPVQRVPVQRVPIQQVPIQQVPIQHVPAQPIAAQHNPVQGLVPAAAPAPAPVPVPLVVEPDPEPEPEPEQDPTSHTIARILEIIPDVEPEYLLGLVQTHLPNFAGQTVEHVLGILFEDGGYPRADPRKKGKKRASEAADPAAEGPNVDERPAKKAKVDYASVERLFEGGPRYNDLALVQLQSSFPFIPKPYLRQCLARSRGLYAPTHLALAAAEPTYFNVPRPYHQKSTRYNPAKDKRKLSAVVDEAFAQERKWLVEHLQDPNETDAMSVGAAAVHAENEEGSQEGKAKGKEKAEEAVEEDEPVEEGMGVECQCCFAEYAFDKMVQCPETHLFCSGCVSQYASTKLGEHDHTIVCMHESGCSQPFPASELRRILSSKLMDLYERVKQQKEIQAAGLEGLEECPFCEWKCVLEVSNEEEKLFRCGNEDGGCGVVSCRSCKKMDHLPKSCKEAEDDKMLDGRHAIEEAMTRALMRNCPKCQKAFVKDAGCNKMTCPNCHTLSCYVCRKVITGYEHFNQAPPGHATSSKAGGKCLLWDKVEERHVAEVKAAAEKAMEEYKRDHPEVDEKDIKVDLPVAPPPQPVAPAPMPVPAVMPFGGYHQYPGLNVAWGAGAGAGVQVQFNFPGVQPAYQIPPLQAPLPPQPVRQTRAQQQQERRRVLQQQRREQQAQMLAQRQERVMQDRLRQQRELQQRKQHEDLARANANFQAQLRAQQQQQIQERDNRERLRAHQLLLLQQQQQDQQLVQIQEAERHRIYQDAMRRHREERAIQVQAGIGHVAAPVVREPARKRARR
ncbi:hypothetical protein GALMADRAFT_224109 [Galerina marginata CBS 339.88]|uniref:RING-type domain-containing protein n=1 Tax=Galerina marginata (strain CBS 339.88) TaxID=685588 RepID=A0A067T919_GALM3|nr:hypothetical protein GALMADRAFT_224109 [Galerina marginata CBS 339.88]